MCICFWRLSWHVLCSITLYDFHSRSSLSSSVCPHMYSLKSWGSHCASEEFEHKEAWGWGSPLKIYIQGRIAAMFMRHTAHDPMRRKGKAWRCVRIQISWMWSASLQQVAETTGRSILPAVLHTLEHSPPQPNWEMLSILLAYYLCSPQVS